MNETQQRERMNFYQDNNIAWVGRPKNNSECGYVRKGKFKKASNMNFALNVSTAVERKMLSMIPETEVEGKAVFINTAEEAQYYQRALAEVLALDSRVKAAGDIRIGEYILIVDSDTKVVSPIISGTEISQQSPNYFSSSSRLTVCFMGQQRCSLVQRLLSFNILLA